MDIESFKDYCLSFKCSSCDFPFDETTLVFRVMNKIFAMTDTDALPFRFNLKCDPEWAVELRERYEAIQPAYHCNKKHWNTVYPKAIPDSALIKEMINHSYELVVKSLKKKERMELLRM